MTAKAIAIAHPIQGLIKYHGLRDGKLRLPFHDSISVCEEALHTRTKVEFDSELKHDTLTIAGNVAAPRELERAVAVLDKLRKMAKVETMARITSENSLSGKGLGYSASAFAALGRAAASALGLADIDERTLSEIVRIGAGSATRSLTGAFSIWYANRNGRSYSEQIAPKDYADFSTVIFPIPSGIMTEQAHREVLSSPFLKSRLKYLSVALAEMKKAVLEKDVERICELAEIDTLNLHATTMTGRGRLLVYEPQSIALVHKVLELRDTGVPCWFSLDTGPSVFVNCRSRYANQIATELKEITTADPVVSNVGDRARLLEDD